MGVSHRKIGVSAYQCHQLDKHKIPTDKQNTTNQTNCQ